MYPPVSESTPNREGLLLGWSICGEVRICCRHAVERKLFELSHDDSAHAGLKRAYEKLHEIVPHEQLPKDGQERLDNIYYNYQQATATAVAACCCFVGGTAAVFCLLAHWRYGHLLMTLLRGHESRFPSIFWSNTLLKEALLHNSVRLAGR